MNQDKRYTVLLLIAIAVAGLTGYLLRSGCGVSPAKPVLLPGTGRAVVGVMKTEGGKVTSVDTASKTLVGSGMRLMLALIDGDSTANPFDESCYFVIGRSSIPTDTSMTDLQGTKFVYSIADSLVKTTTSLTWWKTFLSAVANDTWREIGFFDDSAGTLLDRRVGSWGLKTTADTWITYFTYSVN